MSVVELSYTHPHTHTNEWFVKEVSRKDWRRERGRDKVGEACNWEIQDAKNLTKTKQTMLNKFRVKIVCIWLLEG